MSNESINKNENSIDFLFDDVTQITVYTYGDVTVHRHRATGYKIYDGLLLIINKDTVVATFNRDQWVSVRV